MHNLTREGWRKVVELSAGEKIAVPKLGMFMLRAADYTVVDKHYKDYQTKNTQNTQHDNHFSSPYPATIILEKSPTSFAIVSLDFGLSHFIYMIKHITDFIACQADILECKKAYNVTDNVWGVVAYSKGY